MRFAIGLVVALGLALSPVASAAGKCDRLIATGDEHNPPFLWRDPAQPDRLIGANADLLAHIADSLELKLVMLHTGDAARAYEEVRDGRVDLLVDATLLSERLQALDYVHPSLADLDYMPWVRQDETFYYAGREHLAGRKGVRVAGELGRQFDEFARGYLSLGVASDQQSALQDLAAARVDYVLLERHSAIAHAAPLGLLETLEILEPPVLSQGMHLALSHNSACNDAWLRGQLAVKMTELRAAGIAQKLLNENLERWLEQAKVATE